LVFHIWRFLGNSLEKALDLGIEKSNFGRSYKTRKEETGTDLGDVKKRFEELYAVPKNMITPVSNSGEGQTGKG
jgi:hypothetical protein